MIRLDKLAEKTKAHFIGDAALEISSAACILEAKSGQISMVYHGGQWKDAQESHASLIVCSTSQAADRADTLKAAVLYSENAPLLWARALQILYPQKNKTYSVSEYASVDSDALIAKQVYVGDFASIGKSQLMERVEIGASCSIGDEVTIREGTVIDAHVTIYSGVTIGKNSRIKAGTVLGSPGFGFAPDGEKNISVLQVGQLIIGNNVEIGAQCSIDRGRLRNSIIADGCKIDNQVHLGHGVQLGENVVIIAQTGVAGDVSIGKNSIIGGQSAIAPYLHIGENSRISTKSGVHNHVPAGAIVSGSPAYAHGQWLRNSGRLSRLNSLFKRVKQIEKKYMRGKNDR